MNAKKLERRKDSSSYPRERERDDERETCEKDEGEEREDIIL